MNKGTKTIAIGTLVAGALGYVAGILTAPKSGAETRGSIRHASNSGMAEAEKRLKQMHTELSKLIDEVVSEGKHAAKHLPQRNELQSEIIDGASRTRQKTREIISALHDGSADDRDLDKAVSEAGKAIKSIRSYLKK